MRLRALSLSALSLAAARSPDHTSTRDNCPPKNITSLLTVTSHDNCPATVTSTRDFTAQIPWTHAPRCTTTDVRTYCIFTTSIFGPNGLSLIASPESASALTPSLTRLYHSSLPSQTSVRNLNLQPAFEMQDVPGKGKGLVATRLVQAKETFILDYASLVVDTEFLEDVCTEERWTILDEAVDRLVDPSIVRCLDGKDRTGHTVENVMQTNMFKSELDIGRSFVMFPLISVCCCPFTSRLPDAVANATPENQPRMHAKVGAI